jgi:hypothetical protein
LERRHLLGGALCALCCLWSVSAAAGPWVKKPAEAYLKLGVASFTAEESFNQGVSTGLAYTGVTGNLYAEVGLPSDLQLVVDLPYVMATNQSPQGVNYIQRTFGDARVELDYALLPELPLTFGLETKIPLYTPVAMRQDSQIQAWDQSRNNFPDPGDGNIDITPKLMTGYSFYPVPAWITAELGYRLRLGGFVDGVFAAASGGVFVWPEHLALGVYANTVVNLGEDEDLTRRATREFVYVQGYALLTAAPLAPELSLTAGVGQIVYAKNSAAGQDLSLGVSYAF